MKKLKIMMLGTACALCATAGLAVSNLQQTQASAATATTTNIEMVETASVRKANPEGIRFFARVKTADIIDGATYGVVVYPTADFSGDLTEETNANVLDIPAVYWLPDLNDGENDEEDKALYDEYGFDYEYSYFAAVVGGQNDEFPASAYQQLLTARGYVMENDTYKYSENVAERSIAYVARMALAAGETDENGLLTKVTQGVNIELGKVTYRLNKGETANVSFKYANVPLDPKYVTYEVADDSVASIDENGTITALAGGATNVTATVKIGGAKTEFGLHVKVVEPISDFSENLVQSKYLGYFDTRQTQIAYEENASVNGETVNAFHITSNGPADNDNTLNFSASILKSLIEQGIEEGYTTLNLKMYSSTNSMATYASTSQLKHWKTSIDGTLSFTLNDHETAGILLSLFDSAANPVDTYITEIKFAPYKVDMKSNLVSEKNLANGVFNVKGLDVQVQDEGFEISTTSALQTSHNDNKNYFEIHKDIIAAAIAQGYSKVIVDIELKSTITQTVGMNGTAWKTTLSNAAALRNANFTLADYKNGLRLNFVGNGSQTLSATVKYVYLVRTGVLPTDYSTNVISEDILGFISCAKGPIATYEENATVNGTVTNVIHVTSPNNLTGDPNVGIAYFNINKELINAAIAAGYSKISIKMYTANSIYAYKSSSEALGYKQNTGTTARDVTFTYDLSAVATNGMYLRVGGNQANANSIPADVYVTSITFSN